MTDQLDAIVRDVRTATRRDVALRSRRRRRAGQTLAGALAALTLTGGVAVATGTLPTLEDLFNRDNRSLQVTTAADGAQSAVLDLANQVAGGGHARAAVTDLGVTQRARAVPGASVCETDGAGILSCEGTASGTGGTGQVAPTIPARTHVYRIKPEGASGTAERIIHIPSRGLQLVIVGTFPGAPESVPSPPPGSTERGS